MVYKLYEIIITNARRDGAAKSFRMSSAFSVIVFSPFAGAICVHVHFIIEMERHPGNVIESRSHSHETVSALRPWTKMWLRAICISFINFII